MFVIIITVHKSVHRLCAATE